MIFLLTQVISTNAETFEVAEKTVLETYVRETTELVHLTINGELIKTTHDHPFYVQDVGFVNAGELYIGDKLLDSSGKTLIVEDTKTETLAEPVKVYNFQVEEFHTYYVGNNRIFVHNADCVVHPDGEIEITDWEGYPEGGSKPDGKLKLIEGDDYDTARKAANNENARLHRDNPSYKGKDIHEVHPVKFGGSPTDPSNKVVLPRSEHSKYTRFWNEIQYLVEHLGK